jgi:hypothetical protein
MRERRFHFARRRGERFEGWARGDHQASCGSWRPAPAPVAANAPAPSAAEAGEMPGAGSDQRPDAVRFAH